jgi:hypothetical protein
VLTLPEPLPAGDRPGGLVRPAVAARPSATLLAAQQLSDEADRYLHRTSGLRTPAGDRRRQRRRALLAQRRADRDGPPLP